MPEAKNREPRSRFARGSRSAAPIAIATSVLAISFGLAARDVGLSSIATVTMSAVVFSGGAQFAAVAVLAQGGTLLAAVTSLTLVNARYLPIGVAFARSLPGGIFRRAVQAQAINDVSWALASRGDGTFDRWALFGASLVLYVGWTAGTAIGVGAGSVLGDPRGLGLDAIFPTFFLVLLLRELHTSDSRLVAALGGLIALALVPVVPAGVPVLLAAVGSLWGVRGTTDEASDHDG